MIPPRFQVKCKILDPIFLNFEINRPGGNFDIHNQERVKHGLPKVEEKYFIIKTILRVLLRDAKFYKSTTL